MNYINQTMNELYVRQRSQRMYMYVCMYMPYMVLPITCLLFFIYDDSIIQMMQNKTNTNGDDITFM